MRARTSNDFGIELVKAMPPADNFFSFLKENLEKLSEKDDCVRVAVSSTTEARAKRTVIFKAAKAVGKDVLTRVNEDGSAIMVWKRQKARGRKAKSQ